MRRTTTATGDIDEDTEFVDSDELDDSNDSGDVDSMATADETPAPMLLQDDDVPAFLLDPNIDTRTRARLLEQEINEQATRVDDLKRVRPLDSPVDRLFSISDVIEACVCFVGWSLAAYDRHGRTEIAGD